MGILERNEKIILSVIAVVLIVAVSVLAISRTNQNRPPDEAFTPPQYDSAAVKGTPAETDSSYESVELPISNGKCAVAIDVKPKLDRQELKVFLTSFGDNTVWIRIVLYDGDLNVVGESGIIRPGEYVEKVRLTKEIKSSDALKVKLLTYEPDTYYSLGTASANIIVQ